MVQRAGHARRQLVGRVAEVKQHFSGQVLVAKDLMEF